MTGAEREAKLREAAALVQAVAADLDSTTTACGCCGAVRYNHYGEYRVHVELVPLVAKLQKVGANLARGLHPEKQPRGGAGEQP